MKINTVLGPIDESELGCTLMHEHLTYADRTLRLTFGNEFFDKKIVEDACILQLKNAKKANVDTIIDGSPINLGRDIDLMKSVSKQSGVNIVASSGFYYQNEIYLELDTEDYIFSLVEDEILNGIEHSDVKPGILKIACSHDGVNDIMRKTYRAVARASSKYNLPIFVHHCPELKNGLEILDILKEVGVKPYLVIMGHSGDSNDIEYLESLLKAGCYIGMDRFAFCDVSNSFDNRIDTIVKLINKGYSKQMIFSHDYAVFFGVQESFENFKKRANIIPEVSYDFVNKKVIPTLLNKGIKQSEINTIMYDNPKRILCSKPF